MCSGSSLCQGLLHPPEPPVPKQPAEENQALLSEWMLTPPLLCGSKSSLSWDLWNNETFLSWCMLWHTEINNLKQQFDIWPRVRWEDWYHSTTGSWLASLSLKTELNLKFKPRGKIYGFRKLLLQLIGCRLHELASEGNGQYLGCWGLGQLVFRLRLRLLFALHSFSLTRPHKSNVSLHKTQT